MYLPGQIGFARAALAGEHDGHVRTAALLQQKLNGFDLLIIAPQAEGRIENIVLFVDI